MTIPTRSNGQTIDATWFNTIKDEMEQGGFNAAWSTVSSNTTITLLEGNIGVDASSTTVTISLPSAVDNDGKGISIKALDVSNTVRIDPNGAETIEGDATYVFSTANESVIIRSDGSNWQVIATTDDRTVVALTSHIIDTTTHGTTGDIVGTSDTQNLSNKTFTDATTFNDDVHIIGDLTVDGTTVTLNTETLEVEDNNIVLNNGGNQLSAADGGITVEMSDADDAFIKYDSTLESQFKIGAGSTVAEIVGTDLTQTLEKKTFDDEITIQEIATPATPAADYQKIYPKTTGKWYTLNDAGVESPLGAGSGGGTLDTVLAEDFEITTASDFSTGNNATFLGGGTIDGALSDEETTPMAGTRSIKYTMGSSSANDYVASTAVGIDLKEAGNTVGVNFYYTYNGDDDDIKFVIYDVDNTTVRRSSLELVKAASNPTRFSTSVLIPTGVTELKYGFQVVTGNNGKILEFDDVQISLNPFVYKDILETQDYRLSQATNAMTNTNTEVEFNLGTATISNTGPNIVEAQDDSANTRTKFVAQKKCKVDFSWFGPIGTASRALSIFKNDTFVTAGTSVYVSNRDGGVSGSTELEVGEYITLALSVNGSKDNSDLTSGADLTTVSFVATAATEHIITPAESTLTDWTAFIPTASSGYGSITGATARWRRVGDSMEIEGNFTSGTVAANTAYIDLPSGYTIDTAKVDANNRGYLGRYLHINTGTKYDNNDMGGAVWSDASDTGSVFLSRQAVSDTSHQKENVSSYLNTGDSISFRLTVPISGWSSKATFLAAIPVQLAAYVKDVKSNTTAGGIATGATWIASTLNTVSGDSEIVSLSSNRVLLSTGKYEISASRPFCGVGSCRIRLYDYTNSAVVELGSTGYEGNAVTNSYSMLETSLEVTTATEYQLEYWVTSGGNSYDLGNASSCGSDEVYAQVKITKIK